MYFEVKSLICFLSARSTDRSLSFGTFLLERCGFNIHSCNTIMQTEITLNHRENGKSRDQETTPHTSATLTMMKFQAPVGDEREKALSLRFRLRLFVADRTYTRGKNYVAPCQANTLDSSSRWQRLSSARFGREEWQSRADPVSQRRVMCTEMCEQTQFSRRTIPPN